MSKALRYGIQPTLASLLELQKRETMRQINCHQVGEIVSFNPSTQTAEVQVKMSFYLNGEIKQYPLLLDCPCIVLGGGKGRVTFPIKAGDACLVLFNDRDMDNWYSGGQTMPPRTDRYHDFSDAIALVGLHNKQNQLTDFLADGTELKYGTSTIKLQDNKVTVTDGTAQVVINNGAISITAPTLDITGAVSITGTFSVNGKDVGDTHVHSGVTSGGSNTGGVV